MARILEHKSGGSFRCECAEIERVVSGEGTKEETGDAIWILNRDHATKRFLTKNDCELSEQHVDERRSRYIQQIGQLSLRHLIQAYVTARYIGDNEYTKMADQIGMFRFPDVWEQLKRFDIS